MRRWVVEDDESKIRKLVDERKQEPFSGFDNSNRFNNFVKEVEEPNVKRELNVFLWIMIFVVLLGIGFLIVDVDNISFEKALVRGDFISVDSMPVFGDSKINGNDSGIFNVSRSNSVGGGVVLSGKNNIVYDKGYASVDGKTWEEINFSGDAYDEWIAEDAVLNLTKEYSFVAVFSCDRGLFSWKCNDDWKIVDLTSVDLNPWVGAEVQRKTEERRNVVDTVIDKKRGNEVVESPASDSSGGGGASSGDDSSVVPEEELVDDEEIIIDDVVEDSQYPIDESGLVCSFVSDDICPSSCNVNNDVDCYSTIKGTPIENYGGNPFYVPIYGKLTVTPNMQSGTSTISYTGSENIFSQEFVGKEFVAFRINKNPKEENLDIGYFPNVIGSRYAKVISVQNGKELTVDFAFNGGSIEQPKTSTSASGYFFFDNRQAFVDAILSNQRTEDIVLQSGKTYVTKGAFDVKPLSHVRIRAEDGFTERAMIKLSVEDVWKSPNFRSHWFELGDLEYNIRFSDVNIVGSHYGVPTISGGFSSGLFGGTPTDKQMARTLELRRSDDWTEYYEIRDAGLLDVLPEGYSFIGPSFTYGALYGGRHDGVDVTDFIYLNCLQCDMHVHGFSTTKATVSAGIFKQIIGKSPTEMSQLIQLDKPDYWLSPLQIGSWKHGHYNDITTEVEFGLDPITNKNQYVSITGDGSWYQLSNQYWDGGYCQVTTAPNLLLVDGWELFFANCGNFWWKYVQEFGWADRVVPIDDSMHARMWEQIPRIGDTLLVGEIVPSEFSSSSGDRPLINQTQDMKRISARQYQSWGWGLQEGDKLEANGEVYTIVSRSRAWNKVAEYWYLHVLDLTFDKDVPSSVTKFTVHTSQTEYLLDGEQEVTLRYDRDLAGHLFYDDFNFPYHFENVYMRGAYRGSDKPTDGHLYLMAPVDENGYAKKWINVDHAGGGQMWGSRMNRLRALAEGKPEFTYQTLIAGNYSIVRDIYADNPFYDIVKIVDVPDVTRARLWNPIIDGGVKTAEGMVLTLTDGWSVEIDEVHMLSDGYGVFEFMGIDGNLVINKFMSYPSPINEDYYARLDIKGSSSGENYKPQIRINEGIGMIFLSESTDVSNVDIEIYNWTPKRFGWGSSVLSVQWDRSHVDYCKNVNILGVNGISFDSACP